MTQEAPAPLAPTILEAALATAIPLLAPGTSRNVENSDNFGSVVHNAPCPCQQIGAEGDLLQS